MGTFLGGLAVGMTTCAPGRAQFGTASTSVADFAGLSSLAGRPDGYTVTVTAESGLSADTLVQWDEGGGVWLLVSTACSYAARAAVQWGATPGEWYDSGGVTVETMDGAYLYDTTYDIALRWRTDATPAKSAFFPAEVYDWVSVVGDPITGDSASPSGWAAVDTDAGGAASITTDGTRITITATTAGAGTTTASYTYTDAGIVAGANCYIAALMQITAITGAVAPANSGAVRITIGDGARAYDFGAAFSGDAGGGVANGAYYNAAVIGRYAAQPAYSQDIATAETMVEIVKLGGRCLARAGGGGSAWQAVDASTVRASTGTSVTFTCSAARTSGTQTSSMTIRHVVVARST